ncbi:sensor histidine kinase, HAMP domain-containing [Syntrophotalea carbinolica DSM 2380]|uniref:histidine kinase n=1 Tax=Syntrophotalea carbinolica (strain DSM 2380 / NBRC 103641 / GraBd1) TaxID=338963 RepID=Q39ZY7_SYNC1|nr:ATP-binding protein [Syntrophotalea carbinolica]ABA90320.1 sensor histidine kinase, HAMP domain-containing [Syntrophotalea carbinolica DSM 2380]
MRLTLKHQILIAPAAVLLLMTLLLSFLQYTYIDLSRKRDHAEGVGAILMGITEANIAARVMDDSVRQYQVLVKNGQAGYENLEALLSDLDQAYAHLLSGLERLQQYMPLPETQAQELARAVEALYPDKDAFNIWVYTAGLEQLRPKLVKLNEQTKRMRKDSPPPNSKDLDKLTDRAALVSVIVLGAAIPIGVLLSLFFARGILRRVQTLSDSAGRIVRGDLAPPPAPNPVRDELDDLALSINHMTDQLIRVVGTEKLLEGAEEERRRIAMDIHDQTLCDLSGILRGLQSLPAEAEFRDEVCILEEDLLRAIANLRQLMDNLHPQTLDILGLGAALESHLERHLGKGDMPEYHLYIAPEVDASGLSRLQKLTIYRIAVEAIHNVIKHARASRYEVNLDLCGDQVVLSIEDNGIGFNLEQVAMRAGRGLNNIRERARTIGAQVRWSDSRFSSGTRFELTLPIPAGTQEA